MAIARSEDGLSDETMFAATGRHPESWFALLDGTGAVGWKHGEIARWLSAEQGVADWWCQSISVRYEQARGLRLPGQQPDGTFSVSATKTVDGELGAVYAAMVAEFESEFDDAASSSRDTGRRPFARWKLGEQTVLVTAEVPGEHRVKITATQERLPGPEGTGPAKDRLAGVLFRLAS
jgi:hypothetical protein